MSLEDTQAIVIDASVGIKLFLIEEGTAQANQLFQLLSREISPRFFVPDLFYIECANILWKYVSRFAYPLQKAQQDLKDLLDLAIYNISTVDLVVDALGLASTANITAYDACYAVLAENLDAVLVTADAEMIRKLAQSNTKTKYLMDL